MTDRIAEIEALRAAWLIRWSLRAIDCESDEPCYDGMETNEAGEWVQYETAQERLERAEAERDEALQSGAEYAVKCGRLAAQVTKLREALRLTISAHHWERGEKDCAQCVEARAALGEKP